MCVPLRVEGPPPAVHKAADAEAGRRARLLPVLFRRVRMRAAIVVLGAALLLARLRMHVRVAMAVAVLMRMIVTVGRRAGPVCRGVLVVMAVVVVAVVTVAVMVVRMAVGRRLLCLCMHRK